MPRMQDSAGSSAAPRHGLGAAEHRLSPVLSPFLQTIGAARSRTVVFFLSLCLSHQPGTLWVPCRVVCTHGTLLRQPHPHPAALPSCNDVSPSRNGCPVGCFHWSPPKSSPAQMWPRAGRAQLASPCPADLGAQPSAKHCNGETEARRAQPELSPLSLPASLGAEQRDETQMGFSPFSAATRGCRGGTEGPSLRLGLHPAP